MSHDAFDEKSGFSIRMRLLSPALRTFSYQGLFPWRQSMKLSTKNAGDSPTKKQATQKSVDAIAGASNPGEVCVLLPGQSGVLFMIYFLCRPHSGTP
jgi:hypothetical protein